MRLAFAVTNQTLLPLGDVSTLVSTLPTNSIVVDVEARLDVPTRLLTLTLTALDPTTGWYPESPLTGLLYPNDDTRRGEGSISYVVRAKVGLPSGTVITNRANIVFDFNDPILTPMVSNTLDAAPPTSGVSALPAEAGPAILVQWTGQDDAGGSGLADYDLHVTVDGTNELQWLSRSTATSALFRGEPGRTYTFYSTARDNAGHEEAAPLLPDAAVSIPTNAPVLSEITNRTVGIGSLLVISNSITGQPIVAYLFSLANPVPAGAAINPTNGVLRWTPSCTQASRTHTLTVVVTDTGNPNLRDVRTFTVSTRECVVPQLGRFVLQDGDSGRIPVNLISTVPLTNVAMTVETDPARLTHLRLEPIVPEICAHALTSLSNGVHAIQFSACPGLSLIGTQHIAWLYFTAVTNETSAFVSLILDNTVGFMDGGEEVRNFAPQAGRVVVVGEEPLLEAIFSTNRRPSLILYGRSRPGLRHRIQELVCAHGFVVDAVARRTSDFVPGNPTPV